MLTEDDVVDAVCEYLERGGYRIDKRCATTERGVDIVAAHLLSGVTVSVEAKGETSNRQASNRFGKLFSGAQCKDHVANAFYTAAAMLNVSAPGSGRVAMAFAETSLHRRYVGRIRTAIDSLGIAVFWVDVDRKVTVHSAQPL